MDIWKLIGARCHQPARTGTELEQRPTPFKIFDCCSSRGSKQAKNEELANKEDEDVLAELLLFLSKGSSHWVFINSGPSINICLCKMLGFFSEMDYYACLVLKNLAAYKFNKKNGRWR